MDTQRLEKTILDTLPTGVAALRRCADGTVTVESLNATARALLGADPRLVGDRVEELFKLLHPIDFSIAQEAVHTLFENGLPATIRFRVSQPGGYRWLEASARLAAGQPEGEQLACFSLHTVAEMTDAGAGPKGTYLTERTLRQVLQHTDVNLWEYDILNDTLQNSLATVQTDSRVQVENFSRRALEEGWVRADSAEDFRRLFAALRRGVPEASASLWLKKSAGGWWCEEVCYITEYDADGRPVRARGVGRDVTQVREAETRFQEFETMLAHSEMSGDSIYRLNLTRDTAGGESLAEKISVEEWTRQIAEKLPLEAERQDFVRNFSRQALLDAYSRGLVHRAQTSRVLTENDGERWMELVADLMQNPTNNDIVGVFFLRDIHDQVLSQQILDQLTGQNAYEFLAIVNLRNDRLTPISVQDERERGYFAGKPRQYADALSNALQNFVPGEEREKAQREGSLDTVCKALETQRHYTAHLALADEHGQRAHKEITYSYLDGEHTLLLLTRSDVTDSVALQAAFELEMENLERMQGGALVGKCRANMSTGLVDNPTALNKGVAIPLGQRHDDAVEFVAKNCARAEDGQRFRELMSSESLVRRFNTGKRECAIEYQRRTEAGDPRWMRTVARGTLMPGSGDIVYFIYTYDIDQEKTLRLIVDRIVESDYEFLGLVALENGHMQSVRASAEEQTLFDGQLSYAQGTARFIEAYVEEASREEARRAFDLDAIRQRLTKNERYSFSFSTKAGRAARRKRWEFSYLDENQTRLIFTRSDITELFLQDEQQKETLRNALAQAEAANHAKSDFLSHMSHEIRTPMNAIIGMAALGAQCVNDPAQVADCISKVGISARYLLSLINDILDMSRIESGKVQLRNERFDFENFLQNINSIVYEQVKERGLDYDCIPTGRMEPYYVADDMKLQQVLLNLLSNAVKFTPPGGKVQLMVREERREADRAVLVFTVNDTGIGIAEEDQERIFEPFEQAIQSGTSTYKGTGLGLAISRNLVELMHGSLMLKSIVGVGSEFTVTVPVTLCENARRPAPILTLPRMRVLVVDDEVLICEQTQLLLSEMGMDAEWADSGEAALGRIQRLYAQEKGYDVILIDWRMPHMDGIETTRRIRRIVGPKVSIIIMTAYEWSSIEEAGREAGVDMFITKPLLKRTLVSAFRTVCGEKQEKAAHPAAAFDFSGRRALLVEDHVLNVEVAKRLLESRGMEVDVAENGLRAIERFAAAPQNCYDAILMDIRMPVMDGLTAARAIRQMQRPEAKTIPIIAMSANAFDEDVQKSRAAGMDAHLSKPIEPTLLFETIDRFLNRPQAPEEDA